MSRGGFRLSQTNLYEIEESLHVMLLLYIRNKNVAGSMLE